MNFSPDLAILDLLVQKWGDVFTAGSGEDSGARPAVIVKSSWLGLRSLGVGWDMENFWTV